MQAVVVLVAPPRQRDDGDVVLCWIHKLAPSNLLMRDLALDLSVAPSDAQPELLRPCQ